MSHKCQPQYVADLMVMVIAIQYVVGEQKFSTFLLNLTLASNSSKTLCDFLDYMMYLKVDKSNFFFTYFLYCVRVEQF